MTRTIRPGADRQGRVKIHPELTVPGHPEIFDRLAGGGRHAPSGVAQVALQQGRYTGATIARRVARKPPAPAFRYSDRGIVAVVDPGFAILQSGKLRLKAFRELAPTLLGLILAMRGVITGRDVMQNVGLIYREFGARCLARCLWVLAIGKRTTFLEMISVF